MFTTTVYGGILFNALNINLTFDSDICPGSINNGGDTLDISILNEEDTFTYNATAITGSSQIANQVEIDNSTWPITINGNGNTDVDFSSDFNNGFNLYAGVQSSVLISDASISIRGEFGSLYPTSSHGPVPRGR